MKALAITDHIRKLNGNPFAGFGLGEYQAIEIDWAMKLNRITEERPGPEIERMVERIAKCEVDLLRVVPYRGFNSGRGVCFCPQRSRRHDRWERKHTKAK